MTNDTNERVASRNWTHIANELDIQGGVVLREMLTPRACDELIARYDADTAAFAETLSLASADLGQGERKCFAPPLPEGLAALRASLYARLAPIANRWHEALDVDVSYPDRFDAFIAQCGQPGPARMSSSISRYRKGDFESLHHRATDAISFPLQVVLLLSEPRRDFIGGEFVMTEQRPRMQSRPMVLRPRRGDAAVIASRHRPLNGTRGIYRVTLRHAVSRILEGERYAVDLVFDGAG